MAKARSNRRNSAAKFSRNRALRTPFLRLIFDDGWNGSGVVSAELVSNVQLIVVQIPPREQNTMLSPRTTRY
jgi:hypothetical protein